MYFVPFIENQTFLLAILNRGGEAYGLIKLNI